MTTPSGEGPDLPESGYDADQPAQTASTQPVQLPAPQGSAAAAREQTISQLQLELEAVRADNARLAEAQSRSVGHRVGAASRVVAVIVLFTLATISASLTPVAIWSRNQVLNTDRYVANLTPLASNADVQAGIIKAVDQQIAANVDVSSLLTDVLPPRATVLAGPISSAFDAFVNRVVTSFVQSEAFQTLWVELNRTAHTALVGVLTGTGSDKNAISVTNGAVVLNLAPIVDQVKTRLVASGLSVASNIPSVGTTIQIAQVKGIEEARRWVRLLDTLANWLPWLTLALFAGGIAAAVRRRRALVAAALCIAGAMVVVRLGLAFGRQVYLHNLPGTYLSSSGASYIYDTVTRFLLEGLRIVFVVAVLIALLAMLFGPARAAVAVRRSLGAVPHLAMTRLRGTPAILRWRAPISWGIIGLAALVLLVWNQPTPLVLLVVALIAAALVLVVRAAAGDAEPDEPPAAAYPDEAAPLSAGTPAAR